MAKKQARRARRDARAAELTRRVEAADAAAAEKAEAAAKAEAAKKKKKAAEAEEAATAFWQPPLEPKLLAPKCSPEVPSPEVDKVRTMLPQVSLRAVHASHLPPPRPAAPYGSKASRFQLSPARAPRAYVHLSAPAPRAPHPTLARLAAPPYN